MPGAGKPPDEAVAGAALVLAALLFAQVLFPVWRSVPAACPQPREIVGSGSRTTDVACREGGSAAPRPLRGPTRLLFGERLDLNRADPRALEALPRIGPVRAAAIVAARSERRFESPRELVRVPGIGPRTARELEPLVEVTPECEPGLAGWEPGSRCAR